MCFQDNEGDAAGVVTGNGGDGDVAWSAEDEYDAAAGSGEWWNTWLPYIMAAAAAVLMLGGTALVVSHTTFPIPSPLLPTISITSILSQVPYPNPLTAVLMLWGNS